MHHHSVDIFPKLVVRNAVLPGAGHGSTRPLHLPILALLCTTRPSHEWPLRRSFRCLYCATQPLSPVNLALTLLLSCSPRLSPTGSFPHVCSCTDRISRMTLITTVSARSSQFCLPPLAQRQRRGARIISSARVPFMIAQWKRRQSRRDAPPAALSRYSLSTSTRERRG